MSDELGGNTLLARLPATELEVLRPRLEVVDVRVRDVVHRPRRPIEHVYFPFSAVFSMVASTPEDQVGVEVGTIGHEGLVGLPLFLGSPVSPHAAFCQIAGRAARLPAADLHDFLRQDGRLHRLLHRFTQTTMVQLAQSVACNRAHTTEQRASRWLLTTGDRVRSDRFVLTQDFLGQMLGVRRSTVSEVAGRLAADGLIEYSRGNVHLRDRPRLAEIACPCYGIVKAEFDALATEI
ncbi:Crp/Fnr family transcriptional regulator [Pseudonocardia sp. RS010]|uniref:Crp/Fnr family transcriptional regulator n=1 Tax=Pseudonocardia sp. RS010 TaxID=3385979 RepID=UPI0039A2F130